MAEDIFFLGKFDDANDPRQLEELNQWIQKIQQRMNQFDPNSFSLAWIEGFAAGATIVSMGIGVAPEWSTAPVLTGLRLTGLTASQFVVTDASKNLGSVANPITAHEAAPDPHAGYQKESEKDAANGYAGLNASSRVTKGSDTTDDIIIDLATKGVVVKDTQGTPHYWRLTNTAGVASFTDIGTSKP